MEFPTLVAAAETTKTLDGRTSVPEMLLDVFVVVVVAGSAIVMG